ncbi:MAG: restriction endonuclease [Verrucomicrobiota bacterium]
MNTVTEFRVGDLYTNDQIRFTLEVENLGGVRPALDSQGNIRHVAVLTAAEDSGKIVSENPYRDRIEGDILTYTAQGREGDQQLRGRNKRLIEQYSVPVPFFGFTNVGKQTYRFLGLIELLRHYQETQADIRGALRKVWLFEFRIHSVPGVVPITEARTLCAALLEESRQQTGWSPDETTVEAEVVADGVPAGPVLQEAEQIRSRLLQLHPSKFESFLEVVMKRSGFAQVTVTGKSGDGGIDLNAYVEEANEFFAGTHVQIQAKRWRHSVGSIELNHFRGALSSTAKGVFVTTSHFTRAALTEARHPTKPCITLLDGIRLSSLVRRLEINID